MNKDYVSFELAKLLKENGFTQDCVFFYEKEILRHILSVKLSEEINPKDITPAPMLYQVVNWLRKVHKIYLHVEPDFKIKDTFKYIFYVKEVSYSNNRYETYEEALEEGIKIALNFI